MHVIGINQTVIPEVDIIIVTTTGLLTVFGVVANWLILCVVAKQKHLHKRANALLFSLALLDFSTCALSGPYSIITFFKNSPWPSFTVCRGMLIYGVASTLASCLFNALISINCLHGILSQNGLVHTWNQVLVVAMTVLGWVVFITFVLAPLYFLHEVTFQPRLGVCYINDGDTTLPFAIAIFSMTAVSWIISLICYLKIANIVRISSAHLRVAAVTSNEPVPQMNQLNARNRYLIKLVQTVFITFLFYIVFFIPLLIVELLYRSDLNPHYLLHRTACLILWSSSVLNPYIYIYRLKDIRKAIVNILPCGYRIDIVAA
ncbi:cannabinoid receptor type 1B-like [Lytechinus variegatus]|uniref:cannabinoid receptor type 1B-like n=1 Tax=Lytechinus variegatus TaxID=7654 RepID=UPI001BB29824|nr:cannabinoid receptor type 1B-like [Lytechinus variegatus]XP_041484584.1 cannabinoid receptor type 1B-like [Lytechinus variegatus]